MKKRKYPVGDSLHAFRAAVAEGIVPADRGRVTSTSDLDRLGGLDAGESVESTAVLSSAGQESNAKYSLTESHPQSKI